MCWAEWQIMMQFRLLVHCRLSRNGSKYKGILQEHINRTIPSLQVLNITSGTAKVFWFSGSDAPKTLLEADGTYAETITLPDGGNYIGITCEDFTGSLGLCIK